MPSQSGSRRMLGATPQAFAGVGPSLRGVFPVHPSVDSAGRPDTDQSATLAMTALSEIEKSSPR